MTGLVAKVQSVFSFLQSCQQITAGSYRVRALPGYKLSWGLVFSFALLFENREANHVFFYDTPNPLYSLKTCAHVIPLAYICILRASYFTCTRELHVFCTPLCITRVMRYLEHEYIN